MRLSHIELPSSDVAACVAFFRDVLQLRATGHTVHAGWTDIAVVPATRISEGAVHLAFNVPHARFAAACEWIAGRALLLRDPLGEGRFRIGAPWDSESVYFAGPHDAVFELIARKPLAMGGAASGAFHGSEIACVSEVGLPTDDVPALVRDLDPVGARSRAKSQQSGDAAGLKQTGQSPQSPADDPPPMVTPTP
jgi:catechol 2,3-dioxygenase-like lactoylglutathione lyase family enzyme